MSPSDLGCHHGPVLDLCQAEYHPLLITAVISEARSDLHTYCQCHRSLGFVLCHWNVLCDRIRHSWQLSVHNVITLLVRCAVVPVMPIIARRSTSCAF